MVHHNFYGMTRDKIIKEAQVRGGPGPIKQCGLPAGLWGGFLVGVDWRFSITRGAVEVNVGVAGLEWVFFNFERLKTLKSRLSLFASEISTKTSLTSTDWVENVVLVYSGDSYRSRQLSVSR